MRIRTVMDENYQDYKKPSMLIATAFCDWKCCIEGEFDMEICQNYHLAKGKIVDISNEKLFNRYKANKLTSAIILGGLEPFMQFKEIYDFIKYVRDNNCNDDIIIYTGYNYDEIHKKIEILRSYKNLIVKFGRYKINGRKKYDEMLGVELVSENQYAAKILTWEEIKSIAKSNKEKRNR